MTHATTIQAVQMLFAAYPHAGKQNEQQVGIYAMMLKDIPVEHLSAVIVQVIRECKFVPTVAEIMDRYQELTTDSLPGGAEDGWISVTKALQSGLTSPKKTPKFRDALTQKTVEAMPWQALCESDNIMADRAHFLKIYKQFEERRETIGKLTPAAMQLMEQAAPNKMLKMQEILAIAMNESDSDEIA